MTRQELEMKVAAKLELRKRLLAQKTTYGIYTSAQAPDYVLQEQGGVYVKVDKNPIVKVPKALEKFLVTKKRFKVAFGGRSGGKSFTFGDIFSSQAKDYGHKTLCLREYQNSIKDSVQSMLVSAVDRLGYTGFQPIQDEIRFEDKAVFRFKGLARDPDGVKSAFGFKRFWVEEAQNISAKSLEQLTPTMREEGGEIWLAMNPQHSTDPVSIRFLQPFYRKLLQDGIYEDDQHLIVWLNYKDNPWHNQELERERLFAKEQLSSQQYNHIWLGHYNDEVDNAIIKAEWFDAAIDAHTKLGFKPTGHCVVSHDPSDEGADDKAVCVTRGVMIEDVLLKSDGDSGDGIDWATNIAKDKSADCFIWDADGLGVGLKREVERNLSGSKMDIQMYRGSESPARPNDGYNQPGDSESSIVKTNKDVFRNRRAQSYIALRDRFFATYRAVVKGEYIDPDRLISLNPDIKLMDSLRAELCGIPLQPNPSGKLQIMSKPNMKKLGIPSPNMADAVMMSQVEIKEDLESLEINFSSLW